MDRYLSKGFQQLLNFEIDHPVLSKKTNDLENNTSTNVK